MKIILTFSCVRAVTAAPVADSKPAGRRERPRQKSGLQARRAQGTSAAKKRTPSPQGAGNVRDKKSRTGHGGESRARRERRPRRSRAPRAHWRQAQNGLKNLPFCWPLLFLQSTNRAAGSSCFGREILLRNSVNSIN